MERICEKCRHIIETEVCPHCGSTETREPAADDPCLMTTTDYSLSVMLSEALKLKGIPFRMVTVELGKYSVTRDFYVPYSRLEEAQSIFSSLFREDPPVNENWSDGFGSGLFSADEIDQIDWSVLDDMDLEELKAYKDKISKTLKEIKAMERLWKERSNKLLDMKEEVENLIDELS